MYISYFVKHNEHKHGRDKHQIWMYVYVHTIIIMTTINTES